MSGFITKDSGEREQFDSGMQRDTEAGKPRFDLMIPEGVPYEEQLLTRFAMLLSRGAEKYDARNWEQATGQEEIDRARSSAFRHFMQWYCGEVDEDHAAAVMFNLMVVETIKPRLESDLGGPLAEWERELLAGAASIETPDPVGCIVTVTGDTGKASHLFPVGEAVRITQDRSSGSLNMMRCEYLDSYGDWFVYEVDLA